nr:hypothetical protein [Bradyrhizobium sp. cir1]
MQFHPESILTPQEHAYRRRLSGVRSRRTRAYWPAQSPTRKS